MSEPTLDFTIDLTPALSREVCGKHSIRTGISHTGGDWHPYVDLCPWCAAERAESALAAFREIKAFRVNECDVVAAHSAEEAVTWYKRELGEDIEEEIPEVDLSTMHFRDGANPAQGKCSMRECVHEQIGHMVANNLRFEPWVLSSTEF